jgi:hypothetical protein
VIETWNLEEIFFTQITYNVTKIAENDQWHIAYKAEQWASASSTKTKTKLRGLSPQANYTDRVTAAVGEVVLTLADRGVLRGQRNGSPRPLISVF